MSNWQVKDMPSQSGKRFLVTGANSGIGLTTTKALLQAGGEVVMAVRSPEKGQAALSEIKQSLPNASVSLMQVDLSDLDSVSVFCESFKKQYDSLDVLINNAGIMFPNERQLSAQGFELQLATNHFGHFALTQALMPLLEASEQGRIVTVSSIVTKMKDASIYFEDLHFERAYRKMASYAQSKLANILFSLELQDRLSAKGSKVKCLLAHPGYTATNLQQNMGVLGVIMNGVFAQKTHMGALPTLRAATDPNADAGDYFGPTKFGEYRVYPKRVSPPSIANNKTMRTRLWELTEALTGVQFNVE